MSVSYVVGAGIAQWRLRRRLGGIDGARVLQVIARATARRGRCRPPLGLGRPAGCSRRWSVRRVSSASIIECAVVGTVMGLVYVGASCALLRVRELDNLLATAPPAPARGTPLSVHV